MAATPATVATNNKPFVIELAFQQHTAGAYRSVHHKLNAHYGGIIHDIDDLFTTDGADLPTLITTKVIEHMNLPADADIARFNQMCNSGALTLRWLTYNPETYSRLNKLAYIVDDAATENTNILRIRININGLHFKHDFKAHNFDEIRMEPFADTPMTPLGGTQNNQSPTTPVTLDALERIIAAISPAGIGQEQRTPSLGGNQTQQTGNIVNPASLPLDVRRRLERGDEHDAYLTKQERCSFNSTIPNLIVDPAGNTMRKMFHFMDGPHRMIT